jgi:hypothetical protein
MAYLQECLIAFGQLADDAGLEVNLQVGEPWWWVNPPTQKPCFYDMPTRNAFHAAYPALYMVDFGTVLEADLETGSPYDEMRAFLKLSLGNSVLGCRDAIKAALPNAKVTALVFLPTIDDPDMGIMRDINLPNEQYKYPSLDFIMTEAYDWIIANDMLSTYKAMDYPLYTLNYPPDKIQYLAGCVFPEQPVEQRKLIWARTFGNMQNNLLFNIAKQHIWAYPQVMMDSMTIVAQNDLIWCVVNGEAIQSVRI